MELESGSVLIDPEVDLGVELASIPDVDRSSIKRSQESGEKARDARLPVPGALQTRVESMLQHPTRLNSLVNPARAQRVISHVTASIDGFKVGASGSSQAEGRRRAINFLCCGIPRRTCFRLKGHWRFPV